MLSKSDAAARSAHPTARHPALGLQDTPAHPDPRAPALAAHPALIDLQHLVREYGLA